MAEDRAKSLRARLIRLGFADAAVAEAELQSNPVDDDVLVALGATADPDQALAGLLRLRAADENVGEFLADEQQRTRLLSVLGVSSALTDFVVRHPDELAQIAAGSQLPDAVGMRAYLAARVGLGPDPRDPGPPLVAAPSGSADTDRLDALRVGYRALVLGIAARDLAGELQFDDVGAALANAADAVLDTALQIAAAESPEDAEACRLAVIAMGKTGGSELNYISDVDVIYVAEPAAGADEAAALAAATRLATRLQQICSTPTSEGSIWEVDAALRPEGKAGALVRTLASHAAYYERWAKTWEFQALLKARPAAGDQDLGVAYCDAAAERVWTAANRDGFVADVQAMRRRVEDHIPAREAQRQLKLGRGGLRDVEFAVQLLQLVHGKSDVYVRSRTTLQALEALATWGYVAREDAAGFAASYRWLRSLEHRIQLQRLRRTHLLPTDDAALRRLARSMGLRDAEQLDEELAGHRRRVRQIHEKLFYRPLLDAVARLEPGVARLSPEAARDRLEALGYQDPQGALRHLEALTTGLSRRAQIQRTLLPVLLGWFADYPDPDAGLLGFRQVSDSLGSTPWYLRLLRDAGAAERLVRVLSTSRYATDLLLRAPDAVALLDGDAELQPRDQSALVAEMSNAASLHEDPESAIAAVRAIRRRELFRISVADLLRRLSAEEVGEALTDVATATIQAGLTVATAATESKRGPLPTRFAVIGMGRLGGAEMSYSSDADVLFVHDPLPGADEREATDAAHAVANELRRLLSLPSEDPPLGIDADLRPEGRQGPLVRSLASYAAYYERWSLVWEAQALLRAVPIAGDGDLGRAFLELIDPIRYPDGGLDDAHLREIRRIKARVETERMPRGTDPHRNLKLGPGGLADVEWTAQLLQMRHAYGEPGLRTPRTRAALQAAVDAGLLAGADRDTLIEAWRFAMSVRNAATLVRGKASDTLPGPGRDLAGTALVAGYDPTNAGQLEDDYRRAARHARSVVEREFYR